MSPEQTAMWERPRDADPTPLETGGAVVVIRLSPREVKLLTDRNATDFTAALHEVLRNAIYTDDVMEAASQ